MISCVICNKKLSNNVFSTKDKFELLKHAFICRQCAAKIGINNIFSAATYTEEKARKKYYKMYPEEQFIEIKKESALETVDEKMNTMAVLMGVLEKRADLLQKEENEAENRRKGKITIKYIDDEMSGVEFEHFSKKLLKANRFTGIQVTKSSGDYGADLIAEKDGVRYAIQCKKYNSKVGESAVREVIGSIAIYKCHVGVVLTNNYFSNHAIKLASANNILLWDRNKLIEMMNNMENS